MKVRLLLLVLLGLASLLSNGCSSTNKQVKKNKRVLINPKAVVHSVDYNLGYSDGCASGRNAVGDTEYSFVKDGNKYKIDKEYSAGWDEGYALCQQEYLNEIRDRNRQVEEFETIDDDTKRARDKIWDELKK